MVHALVMESCIMQNEPLIDSAVEFFSAIA